ncbi:MAG: hypothetical protein ACLFVU_00175 [Phycisphaerae bacterium]
MKNAKEYQKRLKKYLADAPTVKPDPADKEEPLRVLVESVLEPDATRDGVQKAIEGIESEFVDYNEVRVSPTKEIVTAMGKTFPDARPKAQQLKKVFRAMFDRTSSLSFEYMDEMGKRDLKRHFQEIGMADYPAASLLLRSFDAHAVPVDQTLVNRLKQDEIVDEESDLADVQGFLERVISAKDAFTAHEFFRTLVAQQVKAGHGAGSEDTARPTDPTLVKSDKPDEDEKTSEKPKKSGKKSGKKSSKKSSQKSGKSKK